MAAIAAFAASDNGRIYAAVCDRWAIDPAAVVGDDVLAYILRASLMFQSTPEVEDTEPSWESAAAANEREWAAGV